MYKIIPDKLKLKIFVFKVQTQYMNECRTVILCKRVCVLKINISNQFVLNSQ